MNDFFTNNPLWIEKTGKIYALLERVKISEEQSKDVLQLRPFIDFMLDVIKNSMYQYIDGSDDPCKNERNSINGGLNGGLNVTQKEIIFLIKENPNIRAFEMAQKLLKPVRTIENNLGKLKEKGVIVRVGSKKSEYWKVN